MPDLQHWTALDWRPHVADAHVASGRLRYVVRGHGPPLLLIHGLGGSWQTWLENIPTLSQRHRVIAVDLPGFGASEPLKAAFELGAFTDAVCELLDQLDAGQVIAVGHSMGGLVALDLAERHPERVSAASLVDAGGVPLGPTRLAAIVRGFIAFNLVFGRPKVMRTIARRPRLRRIVFAGFMGNPGSISAEFASEFVPLVCAPGFADAVGAAGRAVMHHRTPEIRCPVQLLWGDRDRILPLARARELQGRLSNARLDVLEGVGHCPMFEAPGRFKNSLLDFIAEAAR